MSHEARAEAAKEIAEVLFRAETAIEAAISSNAEMMSKVIAAREPGGLSVYHGQEALEEAHALGDLLIKGRRQIGLMHRKLEAIHRQVGLGPAAYGNDYDKPVWPNGKTSGEAAPLQDVA